MSHGLSGQVLGGIIEFLRLRDTPSSYSGQAGRAAVVNAGETALEFAAPAGGASIIRIQPEDLALLSGSNLEHIGTQNVYTVRFPNTANPLGDFNFALPDGWHNVQWSVDLWWMPDNTHTGNVQWELDIRNISHGEIPTGGAPNNVIALSAGPGTQWQVVKKTFTITPTILSANQAAAIRIIRRGDHANDTFTGDANWLAMQIQKA